MEVQDRRHERLPEVHPIVSPLDVSVLMQGHPIEIVIAETVHQIASEHDLWACHAEHSDSGQLIGDHQAGPPAGLPHGAPSDHVLLPLAGK
jgi:hypothetical protein